MIHHDLSSPRLTAEQHRLTARSSDWSILHVSWCDTPLVFVNDRCHSSTSVSIRMLHGIATRQGLLILLATVVPLR